MFVDTAKISIKAGDGGNGAVAFHREKYVAAGGPDGGDGGRGGDVVFVADDNLSTLADFRYKRKYVAKSGAAGEGGNRTGRSAEDLVIRVPRGTLVREIESGLVMADITGNDPVVIARGGKGGFGNAHFATPTRQVPRFAKTGYPGEKFDVELELMLIADVGLIGFPNVGKSTIISAVSEAKPKIANYHFTTLTPVLGVVRVGEEQSFVCADIPGIIEGASQGVGLGHDFLRHISRCRMLVHVVDISGCEDRLPDDDYELINRELKTFDERLAALPQIVALNKSDLGDITDGAFAKRLERDGVTFVEISAATGKNLDKLVYAIWEKLSVLPAAKPVEAQFVRAEKTVGRTFEIKSGDGEFDISAPWLERILEQSNVEDYESLLYFQKALCDSGIVDELINLGAKEGDTVRVGDFEFDYVP